MQSFFNDLSNRDVIKVIASFLDFVSLGNFLKASKIINHACKISLPQREPTPDEIHKALDASIYSYYLGRVKFYDTRVINASCFYRPIEVIIYEDGFHFNMKEHYFVIGDKIQGYYRSYFKNRNLRGEYFFKDDKKQGYCKTYWSNRNLEEECFYKDDKKQGHYKWYWSNGNLGWECFYKDDRKDGVYKEYYKNGNIQTDGFYKDDQKDGLFKEYYENGDLLGECSFENGQLVPL